MILILFSKRVLKENLPRFEWLCAVKALLNQTLLKRVKLASASEGFLREVQVGREKPSEALIVWLKC